jgi:transposase InsO family protein
VAQAIAAGQLLRQRGDGKLLEQPQNANSFIAAKFALFEWIEVFYHREWLHSTFGFHSPVNFETKLN